ncbi:hypothetical protein C8F04DRAFT_1289127 [Mycena alexandri]|uniref:Uncharacterized protein n=1 Tax=Mycena alexandri TaxID=1745969 RepID=A0AAD6WXK6_9AGAR|nr:hypothetical protein C8F04DRAFT_1289127 [Mycena alexandri]
MLSAFASRPARYLALAGKAAGKESVIMVWDQCWWYVLKSFLSPFKEYLSAASPLAGSAPVSTSLPFTRSRSAWTSLADLPRVPPSSYYVFGAQVGGLFSLHCAAARLRPSPPGAVLGMNTTAEQSRPINAAITGHVALDQRPPRPSAIHPTPLATPSSTLSTHPASAVPTSPARPDPPAPTSFLIRPPTSLDDPARPAAVPTYLRSPRPAAPGSHALRRQALTSRRVRRLSLLHTAYPARCRRRQPLTSLLPTPRSAPPQPPPCVYAASLHSRHAASFSAPSAAFVPAPCLSAPRRPRSFAAADNTEFSEDLSIVLVPASIPVPVPVPFPHPPPRAAAAVEHGHGAPFGAFIACSYRHARRAFSGDFPSRLLLHTNHHPSPVNLPHSRFPARHSPCRPRRPPCVFSHAAGASSRHRRM